MGAEATAAPTAEPEVIGVDQVAELVDPLPEAKPAAIKAETAPQAPAGSIEEPKPEEAQPAAAPPAGGPSSGAAAKPGKSTAAPVDVHGRPFDPRLHETTADGKPVFNTFGKRAGKLKCRRTPLREWTEASTIGDEAPAADAAAQPEPQAAAPEVDAEKVAMERRAAAATISGLQLMLMRMALGPDLADEQAQRDALVQSWESVLAYHELQSFNPWVGLIVCTGGIVVANAHKPETKSRLARLTDWTKVKLYALWLRVFGRRTPAATEEPEPKPKPKPAPERPESPEA